MSSAEKDPEAWLEFQLLLLDHGAVIRAEIPDEVVWDDIEKRLTQ